MLAIPHLSQVSSMAEIDSKEAQMKLKAGICLRIPSHNKHTWFLLSKEAQAAKLMKMEYLYDDGDVYVDYSWERALLIKEDVLCGQEHVLTLPKFVILLGLYEPSELDHQFFATHFSKLEIDDKLFDHDACWRKIGQPIETNRRMSLIKEPLMLKENSLICGSHYVTKIAKSLGYLVNEEVGKCSELIKCEKWTTKMLENELNLENYTLLQPTLSPPPTREEREQRQDPSGLNSSWGDWNTSLKEIERKYVWRDLMLMRNNYMLEYSMPILHHFVDQANFAYPTYEPPNVPPYPYPYVPYPHPYTHYPDMGNQPHGGGHYGAPGEAYFTGSMLNFRGTSIVPSSGYEVRGSSRSRQDKDNDASMYKGLKTKQKRARGGRMRYEARLTEPIIGCWILGSSFQKGYVSAYQWLIMEYYNYKGAREKGSLGINEIKRVLRA
ncbi:hypothetical protein Tco_0755152 [Tanacetum coccineum]